jgi:hypothetical protein
MPQDPMVAESGTFRAAKPAGPFSPLIDPCIYLADRNKFIPARVLGQPPLARLRREAVLARLEHLRLAKVLRSSSPDFKVA